jgi:glucose-1-phosphate thymidylyltransferase
VALVLGDNLFFGHGLAELLKLAADREKGATGLSGTYPERYGVVTFNNVGRAVRIEEKPNNVASNWAITGLYFFDNNVLRYAAEVKPSWRGELERMCTIAILLRGRFTWKRWVEDLPGSIPGHSHP